MYCLLWYGDFSSVGRERGGGKGRGIFLSDLVRLAMHSPQSVSLSPFTSYTVACVFRVTQHSLNMSLIKLARSSNTCSFNCTRPPESCDQACLRELFEESCAWPRSQLSIRVLLFWCRRNIDDGLFLPCNPAYRNPSSWVGLEGVLGRACTRTRSRLLDLRSRLFDRARRRPIVFSCLERFRFLLRFVLLSV